MAIDFENQEKKIVQEIKTFIDNVCKNFGMKLIDDAELVGEPQYNLTWKHCADEEVISKFKKQRNKISRQISTLKKEVIIRNLCDMDCCDRCGEILCRPSNFTKGAVLICSKCGTKYGEPQ